MLFELRCTRQLITVDRTELGRTGTEGVLFLIEKNNFTAFFKRRGYIYIPPSLFPPCRGYWLLAWLSDCRLKKRAEGGRSRIDAKRLLRAAWLGADELIHRL